MKSGLRRFRFPRVFCNPDRLLEVIGFKIGVLWRGAERPFRLDTLDGAHTHDPFSELGNWGLAVVEASVSLPLAIDNLGGNGDCFIRG